MGIRHIFMLICMYVPSCIEIIESKLRDLQDFLRCSGNVADEDALSDLQATTNFFTSAVSILTKNRCKIEEIKLKAQLKANIVSLDDFLAEHSSQEDEEEETEEEDIKCRELRVVVDDIFSQGNMEKVFIQEEVLADNVDNEESSNCLNAGHKDEEEEEEEGVREMDVWAEEDVEIAPIVIAPIEVRPKRAKRKAAGEDFLYGDQAMVALGGRRKTPARKTPDLKEAPQTPTVKKTPPGTPKKTSKQTSDPKVTIQTSDLKNFEPTNNAKTSKQSSDPKISKQTSNLNTSEQTNDKKILKKRGRPSKKVKESSKRKASESEDVETKKTKEDFETDEESEADEDRSRIDLPKVKHIMMTKHICFLCKCGTTDYGSMRDLAEHVMETHFNADSTGKLSHTCSYCSNSFTSGERWYHVADMLSTVLTHLLADHPEEFSLPEYVHELRCLQAGCSYKQYTLKSLKLHLMRVHKITVSNWSECMPMVSAVLGDSLAEMKDSTKELAPKVQQTIVYQIPGQKRLRMTEFRCIFCNHIDADGTVFDYAEDLMEHTFDCHTTEFENGKSFSVKCMLCDEEFTAENQHFGWISLCDVLRQLLKHLLKFHDESYTIPEYISLVECPEETCTFTSFTLQDMKSHLSKYHDRRIANWEDACSMFPWLARFIDDNALGISETNSALRHLRLSQIQCIICSMKNADDRLFSTEAELVIHIREVHMTKVKKRGGGHMLSCFHCPKAYYIPPGHFNWTKFSDLFRVFFAHMAHFHEAQFKLPDFVLFVDCPFNDCSHTTYTVDTMRKHLSKVHAKPLISWEEICEQFPLIADSWGSPPSIDKPNVTEHIEVIIPNSRTLCMTRYECFFCLHLKGISTVFANQVKFAQHIKSTHLKTSPRKNYILDCLFCEKYFKFVESKTNWSALSDTMSRYLVHMEQEHEYTVPAFIRRLTCTIEDCTASAFTVHSMRLHMKHQHHVLIVDKEKAIEYFPWITFGESNVDGAAVIEASNIVDDTEDIEEELVGDVNQEGGVLEVTIHSKNLILTQWQCFMCFEKAEEVEVYETEEDLAAHVQQAHILAEEGVGFFLKCGYCFGQYPIDAADFDWISLSGFLVGFLEHLVHEHQYAIPEYVAVFKCPIETCTFPSLTLSAVTEHLTIEHQATVPDADIIQSTFPVIPHTLKAKQKVLLASGVEPTGSKKLMMTEHICFICEAQHGVRDVFMNEAELVNHVRLTHLRLQASSYCLKCIFCEGEYKLTSDSRLSTNEICVTLARYLTHLIRSHHDHFSFPEYVHKFECPVKTCLVARNSLFGIQKHLQNAHGTDLTNDKAHHLFPLVKELQGYEHPNEVGRDCPMYKPRKRDSFGWYDGKTTGKALRSPADHQPYSFPYNGPERSETDCQLAELSLTSLECFLCPDLPEFPQKEALILHLMDGHTQKHTSQASLKCPCCSFEWIINQDIMEVLVALCSHLHTCHKKIFPLPEYIRRFSCPLVSCGRVCFSPFALKRHMANHQLYLHTNKYSQGWTSQLSPSHLTFASYICFECKDDKDYHSFVDFINHWLSDHFSCGSTNISLTCQSCKLPQGVVQRNSHWLFGTLSVMASYFTHLMTEHGLLCPSYIKRLPEGRTLMDKPSSSKELETLYGGINELELNMTQLTCFQCETKPHTFSSRGEFFNHWQEEHANIVGEKFTTTCRYCSHSYSIHSAHPGPSEFFDFLATYCFHIKRLHNILPDFVRSVVCPVYGCPFEALTLQKVRNHMKIHGLLYVLKEQMISGHFEFPARSSDVQMTQLSCFICPESGTVYNAPLFFINHWLKEHMVVQGSSTSPKFTLECTQCNYEAFVTGRLQLPEIWEVISMYLIHLVDQHGMSIPDQVQRYQCTVADCGKETLTKVDSEKHALLHTEVLTEALGLTSLRELQYLKLHCFECSKEDFADREALSEHWRKTHLSFEESFIECSICELSVKGSSDVLQLASEYLLHLVASHNFVVPEYITMFPCQQILCNFSTYIQDKLIDHHVKCHFEGSKVLPRGDQVVFAGDGAGDGTPDFALMPLDLNLTSFCCLLCNSSKFGNSKELNSHLHDEHTKRQGTRFYIPCPGCPKKFFSCCRRRQPLTVLANLVVHMAEHHDYTPPNYVNKVPCNQPDCTYFTYFADHLATHVKQVHGIIDANLARVKAKSFFQRRKTPQNSNCKLTFKLRRYQCFICEDVEKTTITEYARHWRDTHYEQQADHFLLKCHFCDRQYKLPADKFSEASSALINITFYFMHMVNRHQLVVPDYVVAYKCEIPDCDFVTYTLSSLEAHCKNTHQTTPADMMEMTESKNPSTSSEIPSKTLQVQAGAGIGVPVSAGPATQEVPGSEYLCFTCGKEFPTYVARKEHIQEAHTRSKSLLCYICSARFAFEPSLKNHLYKKHGVVGEKEKILYCDQCDFNCIRTTELSKHLKRNHSI
ncbi:hypothetical protein CAPTEDRAFT_204450 [Capitella teleta]|uniref:C2H2-type domain-containing protein n=1 Tax=Capitella teleta TaxID=283909 RepID=R7VEK4_CAPTE|nr:hypothetical protein CAPTEDRAFT_204450 [Capitella teleta]|eukprot:ELU14706.1 hypothetical protein CAPTEDRAFT_204450 [Capitella teleta]